MKKAVAMFLAAMMAVSFSTVSFAEAETEAVEMNWEDVAPYVESELKGRFVTFDEIAAKMWIPEELKEVELTDDDVEQGFIGYFANDDLDKVVSVVYVDMDGASLEEYAEALAEIDGIEDIEVGKVNGLDCVSYAMPDQDSGTLAFATEQGAILEVTLAPVSDEDFMSSAAFVTMSIMPEDEAETEG